MKHHVRAIQIETASSVGIGKSHTPIMEDTVSTVSIADLFEIVKRNDKEFTPNSVNKYMLNEDGTPKVFYHGTNADFTVFDLKKSGSNFGNVSEGMFFFTDKKKNYPSSAEDYAKYVTNAKGGKEKIYDCYLRMHKPLVLDSSRSYDPISYYDRNAEKIYEKYFEGDYDGIIVTDFSKKNSTSILALVDNSAQIKSATNNIGTFDKSEPDIRYDLADTETNTKYLAAVKSGDMKTAQRMVDKAAKKAGYTIKAYHGTEDQFNTFNYDKIGESTGVGILGEGFYFTNKKKLAQGYGSVIKDCYQQISNPYMASADEGYRLNTQKLIQQGFDGVILTAPQGTVYMVFENTQIKSAEPVVYDDDGKVIPLSERFDPENVDIRYSVGEDGKAKKGAA